MGAQQFAEMAKGKTAKEAFADARTKAFWDYGHAGYTGTIAEKDSFTVITVPVGTDPSAFVNDLMRDNDPRIDDKWGPAGCVRMDADTWCFFGWASS